MPWPVIGGYRFTKEAVERNAPERSGIYGLYRSKTWVYIGESDDIRRRLLEHLDEQGTCIKRYADLWFSYELYPAAGRAARQNALIRELKPVCNQLSE
jgi:predicted GIY-YIG superfamily endonuclease